MVRSRAGLSIRPVSTRTSPRPPHAARMSWSGRLCFSRRRKRNVQPHHDREQRHRRSKKFYDALFVAMGAQPATPDARGRLAYTHNGGSFLVPIPIDGKPANHAQGGTTGILNSSSDTVEDRNHTRSSNSDQLSKLLRG